MTTEEQIGNPIFLEIMSEQMKMRYTPRSTDDNQLETEIERAIREVQSIRHRNATINKTKTRISITFKRNLPKVGAVLGTKTKNYKERFHNLQENLLQHVVATHTKGADLAPLITKLEDVDLSSKEPGPPT